jgi:hypothetical protein
MSLCDQKDIASTLMTLEWEPLIIYLSQQSIHGHDCPCFLVIVNSGWIFI